MIVGDDILTELDQDLDDLVAEASGNLSKLSALKAIKEESVAYTKHILDALTTEELQSESAWMRFRLNVLAQARMRLHERR